MGNYKCWMTDTEECVHGGKEQCEESFRAVAIVVFCDDTKCMFNVPILPKVKYVKHQKDHQTFPNDYAKGVCGRKEIHLLPKDWISTQTKWHVTSCAVRSDKYIAGHMDFARLLNSDGTPYGGSIESQYVDPEEYRNMTEPPPEKKWV